MAVKLLKDQSLIARIALCNPGGSIRLTVAKELQDKAALLAVVRSEIERADTDDYVGAYAARHVTKEQFAGIAWSERSKAKKLAGIMTRVSVCALCREPVETRLVDWKGRCGSCSGAS